MVENYLIGDTIRFTASIVNLDGDVDVPGEVTVTVYQRDGTILLNGATATASETAGEYYYDWKIEGPSEEIPVSSASDLIVVWDWDSIHKKRMKFKVVLETD